MFRKLKVHTRKSTKARLAPTPCKTTPIHDLPTEVLAGIFEQVLRKVYPDALNMFNGIWTLSRVCRYWRDIAFGTPALWTVVNVEFTQDESPRYLERMLEDYLEFSQEMPLTLRVRGRSTNKLNPMHTDPTFAESVEVLLRASQRWQVAELYGCLNGVNRMLTTPEPFLELQNLALLHWSPANRDIAPCAAVEWMRIIDNAPNLRSVLFHMPWMSDEAFMMTQYVAEAWDLDESYLTIEFTNEDIRIVIDDGHPISQDLDKIPGGRPVIPVPRPCWVVLLAVRANTSSGLYGSDSHENARDQDCGCLSCGVQEEEGLTTHTSTGRAADLDEAVAEPEDDSHGYTQPDPAYPHAIMWSRLDWHTKPPIAARIIPSTTCLTLRLGLDLTTAKMIQPWLSACMLPNLEHLYVDIRPEVKLGPVDLVDGIGQLMHNASKANLGDKPVDITTFSIHTAETQGLNRLLAHLPTLRTLNLVEPQQGTALVRELADDELCPCLSTINIDAPLSLNTNAVKEVLEARDSPRCNALEKVTIKGGYVGPKLVLQSYVDSGVVAWE